MSNRMQKPGLRRAYPTDKSLALALLSLIAAPAMFAQQAAPAPAAAQEEEEIIMLSPFTVDSSTEKGFFAQNTLAGSRLRTNVSDLASSISVVTKAQLEDTASLDINDVFRYEIGTEGSTTYTPTTTTMRGDGVADAVGGASFGNNTTVATNATANRVRGIGSPTMSVNYYPAISAVPFDTYNTQSVEISRGPNSLIFGMGSPAGIVNQSTASADVNRDFGSATLRVDDRGSFRSSVNFNTVLAKRKLAFYGAAVYNDQAFERKPSYDTTRRLYAAVTYKPFKRTKISASIESYNNDNRRPNSLTPIDTVSQWKDAGQPVYNAVTKRVTWLKTGKVSDVPYLLSGNVPEAAGVVAWLKAQPGYNAALLSDSTNATSGIRTVNYGKMNIFSSSAMTQKYVVGADGRQNVLNPFWVPGLSITNSRSIQRISNGQLYDWQQPLAGVNYATSWGANSAGTVNVVNTGTVSNSLFVYKNAAWADYFQRQPTRSANYNAPDSFVLSTYNYPGVTDRSVYDWENINASQSNFGSAQNRNVNLELEQEILPNLLTFNAGYFRQTFSSTSTYTIAQLNATSLMVDTNATNMDGSVNPYLGQVFVEDVDPDRFRNYQDTKNYRGMLAFTPDFTKNGNWTKWFGRHQMVGLWSYMNDDKTAFRDRLTYVRGSIDGMLRYLPNPLPNSAGAATGWRYSQGTVRRYYYMSNPGDAYGQVTRSSGSWDNAAFAGNIGVYDYTNNKYTTSEVETAWDVHDGGTQINGRTLTSYSGAWTGYLWKDRIITTAGLRRDINRTRVTTNGATATEAAMTNPQKWVDGVYQYDAVFNRWTQWSEVADTTSTMGVVFKPFSGWGPISRRAAEGNVFWQFVDSLGFSANQSDNFDAPTSTNVDLFGNQLKKPEGTGKDFGVQFALGSKLFARINWFSASNENMVLGGTAKTAMDRLSGHIDTDTYRSWLETLYLINQGLDPTATDWRKAFDQDSAKVNAMQDYIGKNWWGLGSWNYYSSLGGTVGGTTDAKAKGTEVEINYNPTRNWTMRFTGAKVVTRYSNSLSQFNAWNDNRMPTWMNAKATDFLKPEYAHLATYTNAGGANVVLTNFWNSTNFNSNIKSDSINGWYTPKDYYASVVTPQYTLARDLEGTQAMGQSKYTASAITTYTFSQGALKGFAIGGGQRWSSKSILGYYGKASGADALFPNKIDATDTTKPIYNDPVWYTDLWINYTTKILKDKVKVKIQLNVNDVFQGGELRQVSVNRDGSPASYRIIDPRTFVLSTTFSF